MEIDVYAKMMKEASTIFEDNYVNPKNVSIRSDGNTKNLIYIYLESMEIFGISKENGGAKEKSYIPNLEKLALNNTNFSNTNKLGGAYVLEGGNWTAGALIPQTSGVLLKISIDGNQYKGYSSSLPGTYSIGEVLENNGYSNYFLMGSDAEFGGRKDYFIQHGNYEILDCFLGEE